MMSTHLILEPPSITMDVYEMVFDDSIHGGDLPAIMAFIVFSAASEISRTGTLNQILVRIEQTVCQ